MNKKGVNLNTRGNCMPSGKKSIKKFYEEMIAVANKNIGKVSHVGTEINQDFISGLELRSHKLKNENY